MLKEIFDEPQTLRQALKIPDEEIQLKEFVEVPQAYLVGVGTTFYVAQLGQYFTTDGALLPSHQFRRIYRYRWCTGTGFGAGNLSVRRNLRYQDGA